MKSLLLVAAQLTAATTITQGYLQLRLAEQYEKNYGAMKLDLCATNFKHMPDPTDCKNAPTTRLQLIPEIGMVVEGSVTKRSRQVDFGFDFSWPGDLSLITWMHNKPDSFSGKLSPNPKNDDSWTPIVFEHSQKVLIEARVICTDNYYGVKCDTYCEESEHYTCDVTTGHKKCKDDWQTLAGDREQCTSPVCDPSCSVHGRCVAPGKCQCDSGFQGQNCADCITSPGCRHGQCVDNRPYTCQCHSSSWIGAHCDIPTNPCFTETGRHMCLNGGQCAFDSVKWAVRFNRRTFTMSDVSHFLNERLMSCECPTGYAGLRCEAIEIKCENGGVVDATLNRCVCPKGTTGLHCESMMESTLGETKNNENDNSLVLGVIIGIVIVVALIVVAAAAIVCMPHFKSAKPAQLAMDDEEIAPTLECVESVVSEKHHKSRTVTEQRYGKGHDRTAVKENSIQGQHQPPSYNDVVGHHTSRGDTLIVSSS